jgi:hypothetical protein
LWWPHALRSQRVRHSYLRTEILITKRLTTMSLTSTDPELARLVADVSVAEAGSLA